MTETSADDSQGHLAIPLELPVRLFGYELKRVRIEVHLEFRGQITDVTVDPPAIDLRDH
jgi:hypothetical protein